MACVVPLMLWTAALGGSIYDDAKSAQTFLVFPLVPFAALGLVHGHVAGTVL